MWDTSIPKIHLAMHLDSLNALREHVLPEKYGWRFFEPGDGMHWARIETSAGEFACEADALARFRREFFTDDGLEERMIFLTESGVPFATATAWMDSAEQGHLHYVAIDDAHQGQGLCRPLVYIALKRMAELGHSCAHLTTQTYSWAAIKVYHDFGFHPVPFHEDDEAGWKLVSQKTCIPFELK